MPDFVVVECNQVVFCTINVGIRFQSTVIDLINGLRFIALYNFKTYILLVGKLPDWIRRNRVPGKSIPA